MKSPLRVEDPSGPEILRQMNEWLLLTDAETEAIQQADWVGLQQAQSRKGEVMDQWNQSQGPGVLALSGNLREQVVELAKQLGAKERVNQTLLATRLDNSRREISALGTSARNLKQLHSAYQSSSQAGWQWYS